MWLLWTKNEKGGLFKKYEYLLLCLSTYYESGGTHCKVNRVSADKLKEEIWKQIRFKIEATIIEKQRRINFEQSKEHNVWIEYRQNKIEELNLELEKEILKLGATAFENILDSQMISMIDFNSIYSYRKFKVAFIKSEIAKLREDLINIILYILLLPMIFKNIYNI